MAPQLSSAEESSIRHLYGRLIKSWNEKNARDFAACFSPNGNAVGFDGTQMDGARQIEESLQAVFGNHPTAKYVAIVREARSVGTDAIILRAVAGMVSPDASKIKSDVNAIQSLLANRTASEWKIALFQSTPAAFHGRPEAVEALTKELQSEYERRK